MANGESSTSLKVSLAFFVFLSLILGVFVYTTHSDATDNAVALKKAKDDLGMEKNRSKIFADSIDRMSSTIGIKGSDFDDTQAKLKSVMKKLAGEQEQGTVNGTLLAMKDKISNELTRADGLQREISEANTRMAQIDENAQNVIKEEKDARDKAVRDLAEVQNDSREKIAKIQKDNEQLQERVEQIQLEYNQFRESAEQKEQELTTRNRKLTNTNNQFQERLAQLLETSYERADGKIIRADFESGLVWLNIGSASGLTERTRFSVYIRKNRGVARGTDEVKGAIEVTEILGEHQSIARIIDEEIGRPIANGDPVYSPAWSAGGQLAVSVVGLIDLDHDGHLDRDRFHELIKENQAVIDNEVDEKGVRSGNGISVNTKFLVVGEIPDVSVTQQPKVPEEVVEAIAKAHNKMVAEAREQGVRIISLKDFLQYLGYRPTQRLWMRTSGRPWNLKHGQRFSDAEIESGKFHSSGTVSGLYTRGPNTRPPVSSGQVSKLYRKVKKQYP